MTKAQELLLEADLNWTVSKERLEILTMDRIIESPYYGVVRSDNQEILGSVSNSYHIVQNLDLMNTMVEIADNMNGCELTKAYSINGGRKIMMQIKLPQSVSIGGEDIARYVMAITSHDKSTGVRLLFNNIVPSCANQFARHYKNAQFRFRHSSDVLEQLKAIPRMIVNGLDSDRDTFKTYRQFESTPATMQLAKELIHSLNGTDISMSRDQIQEEFSKQKLRTIDDMIHNVEYEFEGKGETLWGLFNGITYYTNHHKKVMNRENGRIESLMVGAGSKVNNQAFNYLKQLV